MADISVANSNYVRFYILSESVGKLKMEVEPGGWRDDDLELDRSKDHGIFNKFSNSLSFYKQYRDAIENTFQQLGNNGSLYLIKEELFESDSSGDVVWTEVYRGRADWETKKIKNSVLTIKFNSNDLEEKISANATDEFELETTTSVDDIDIGELDFKKTSLAGRNISFIGRSVLLRGVPYYDTFIQNKFWFTLKSEIILRGTDRHSSIDQVGSGALSGSDYGLNNGQGNTLGYVYYDKGNVASNMFFVDTTNVQATAYVRVKYKIRCSIFAQNVPKSFVIAIMRKKKKETDGYINVGQETLENITINPGETGEIDIEGYRDLVVPFNQGLVMAYKFFTNTFDENLDNFYRFNCQVYQQDIEIVGHTYYEPSLDLDFLFAHDVYSRLLKIIANKDNLFYSKYFGRTELGYQEDGEAGLVGLMSGFQARAFNRDSERYKSPTYSWKKLLDSCNSVFNVGMGTQIINNIKKVRIEEVKYFYQQEIVIRMGQVSNLERKYDKSLYFSGIEIGYNKGGDYENEIGLDEPNTLSKLVTPDRKSKNKYQKISDIRSDEYGLEKARRKPEILYPAEDTRGDSHNWFLDLKRTLNESFEQKDWPDRLASEPTGIADPNSYRSFFFTPIRMLLRHGWILRAGIENYLDKKIKFISSKSNSNLTMRFIGEDEAFSEELPNGLEVRKLDRAKMVPEQVTFEYGVDRKFIEKMYSTTRVFYKGSWEDIPNYYFKMEWINEKQEKETGYLMNFKPSALGKFKMQKSNDKKL